MQIATSAALGASSIVQTAMQNDAIDDATAANSASQDIASASRREVIARRFGQAEGAIRASAGARGGSSQSSGALIISAFDAASRGDTNEILSNSFAKHSIRTAANANKRSPFFSGIEGGIQGFAFGSQIEDFLESRKS